MAEIFNTLAEDELKLLSPGLQAIATLRVQQAIDAALDDAAEKFREQLATSLKFRVDIARSPGKVVLTVSIPDRNTANFEDVR